MIKTFGQALRDVREAAGMKRAALALRAMVSEVHIRNIENGHRAPPHDIARACDEALGTGGLLVDLYIAESGGDPVRRRLVLDALGTIVGLGIVSQRLLAESLRAGILSALDCDDWQEVAAEYGRRFMTDPPTIFLEELVDDLRMLRASILGPDSTQTRLAAPRLMTLYGMAIANLGDVSGATRWYRAARLAADRTKNPALRQWTRGREAFRRGYEGTLPSEVLALAAGVHDIEAKLAVAQAYARLGETSKARTALNDARRVHETSDQSETTIYAMPPWRMALSSGYVYALLGDVVRCDNELTAVAPPLIVKRWEAQLEIQRAVAIARAGDFKSGIEKADAIVRALPNDQRSVVVAEMYREVKRCAHAS